jgi:hypothetical protein
MSQIHEKNSKNKKKKNKVCLGSRVQFSPIPGSSTSKKKATPVFHVKKQISFISKFLSLEISSSFLIHQKTEVCLFSEGKNNF